MHAVSPSPKATKLVHTLITAAGMMQPQGHITQFPASAIKTASCSLMNAPARIRFADPPRRRNWSSPVTAGACPHTADIVDDIGVISQTSEHVVRAGPPLRVLPSSPLRTSPPSFPSRKFTPESPVSVFGKL